MTIHIQFRCGSDILNTAPSPEVIEVLEQHGWLVAGAPDTNSCYSIPAQRVREEIQRALESVASSENRSIYLASEMVPAGVGKPDHFSTGMMGLAINGEPYLLITGYDRCELRKLRPTANRATLPTVPAETQDVRSREFLDTDGGRIVIARRPAPNPVVAWLRKLARRSAGWSGTVEIEVA